MGSTGVMLARHRVPVDIFVSGVTLVSSRLVVSGYGNGNATIVHSELIDSFVALSGLIAAEVNDVSIRDSSVARSSLEVSDAHEFRSARTSIYNVSGATHGAVRFLSVGLLNLTSFAVANSTATFGGAFFVRDVGVGGIVCHNVTTRNSRALIAGGSVFIDDLSNAFVGCSSNENSSADAYGPVIAGGVYHLRAGGIPAVVMSGIGVPRLEITIGDQFGNVQRAAPNSSLSLRRSKQILIFANVDCSADNGTAFAIERRYLCTVLQEGASCAASLPLPVARNCTVTVSSDQKIASAVFAVSLAPSCEFGYGAERGLCRPCAPDFVSIGAGEDCLACPAGARCCGADRVWAKPEHWLVANGAVAAFRCLTGVCVGSNRTCVDDEGVFVQNQCIDGRNGTLCSHCVGGANFIPVAPNDAGVACLECNEINVGFAALIALAVAVSALVVHVNSAGNSAALKILLYYAQMAGLQAPAGLFATPLTSFFGFRLAAATASFGGVCLAPWGHFELVVVRLMLPFAMLASLLLFAGCWRLVALCRRRRRQQTRFDDGGADGDDGADESSGVLKIVSQSQPPAPARDLFGVRRLLRTMIAIVLMTFTAMVAASLDVLHCVAVGRESLLMADTRESCESSVAVTWQRVATFALLPGAAILIASLPVLLLVLRRRNGNRLPEQHEVFGVLFEPYRTERARLFFEAFVLLRRAAAGLIAVFVESAPLKHFFFTAINVGSLLTVVLERPYVSAAETWLDVVSQAFLCLVGCAVVTSDDLGPGGAAFAAALSSVPLFLTGGFMARTRVLGWWRSWRAKRSRSDK